MRKVISLAQVKQEHQILCPDVSLEFFMEHYCNNILEEGKFTSVEVVVVPRFSFIFKK